MKRDLLEILLLQNYPRKMSEYLMHIAGELGENGLAWVLVKAYCLGVIEGKREERLRRRKL